MMLSMQSLLNALNGFRGIALRRFSYTTSVLNSLADKLRNLKCMQMDLHSNHWLDTAACRKMDLKDGARTSVTCGGCTRERIYCWLCKSLLLLELMDRLSAVEDPHIRGNLDSIDVDAEYSITGHVLDMPTGLTFSVRKENLVSSSQSYLWALQWVLLQACWRCNQQCSICTVYILQLVGLSTEFFRGCCCAWFCMNPKGVLTSMSWLAQGLSSLKCSRCSSLTGSRDSLGMREKEKLWRSQPFHLLRCIDLLLA